MRSITNGTNIHWGSGIQQDFIVFPRGTGIIHSLRNPFHVSVKYSVKYFPHRKFSYFFICVSILSDIMTGQSIQGLLWQSSS